MSRSRAALERARDGEVWITASVVRGPVTVLGARQRASAVVLCGDTARRATTGVEVFIGEVAVWWSLALPGVAALHPDATADTLLNRNVRGFLRGLSACGVSASYLGRDALSVHRRVGAALGYDVTDDGRALLDVIAGWSAPLDLPAALRAPERVETPRPEGIALGEVSTVADPETLAIRVVRAMGERLGRAIEDAPQLPEVEAPPEGPEPIVRGATRAPIGRVEAGERGGLPWLGGDLLASTSWLNRFERALSRGEPAPDGAVLHGARPEDLYRAWRGGAFIP